MGGVVYIDGETVEESIGEDVETVSVEFDWDGSAECERDDCREEGEHVEECDYAGQRFAQGAEAFVNGAGVRVGDDEVRVWISTGDPRGGFSMSVRRLADGRLVLHVPYAGMGWSHEDLYPLSEGTFQIREAPAAAV